MDARISNVSFNVDYDGTEYFELTIIHGSEEATVDVARTEEGDVSAETQMLDATSEMDEIILEEAGKVFVRNHGDGFADPLA